MDSIKLSVNYPPKRRTLSATAEKRFARLRSSFDSSNPSRTRRRWWRRSSGWWSRTRLCNAAGCADLVTYFGDANRANLVEYSNYVAIHGHRSSADGDFDVLVGSVKLEKAGEYLIVWYVLIVEEHSVSFQNLNRNEILHPSRGRSNGRWQI